MICNQRKRIYQCVPHVQPNTVCAAGRQANKVY